MSDILCSKVFTLTRNEAIYYCAVVKHLIDTRRGEPLKLL